MQAIYEHVDRRSVGLVRQSPSWTHYFIRPILNVVQRIVPCQQGSPSDLLRCL